MKPGRKNDTLLVSKTACSGGGVIFYLVTEEKLSFYNNLWLNKESSNFQPKNLAVIKDSLVWSFRIEYICAYTIQIEALCCDTRDIDLNGPKPE